MSKEEQKIIEQTWQLYREFVKSCNMADPASAPEFLNWLEKIKYREDL